MSSFDWHKVVGQLGHLKNKFKLDAFLWYGTQKVGKFLMKTNMLLRVHYK